MQVLLHSDPNTDGGHLMAEHLASVVKEAMSRFGERLGLPLQGDATVVCSHTGDTYQLINDECTCLVR